MDFGVLSKYDDLLASYFLDSFYLWFSTVRMNMDFSGPQIDTAPIVAIIRDQIVKQRDPSKAANAFLKIPYFQDFLQDKSEKRRIEFTQHLKRYMYMFMPNAGFEISSTDRYTGQMEACIVATRDWEAGEQVTCCQGAIAELNSEEDAKLKKEGRDFSVMVSTRKKCTCLFLGPARFMNHDCDANCEFILLNQNAITFRIKRNIAEGEEMTVFYGEHYFGEDNCECLCASCEKRQEGSFSVESENKSSADDNATSRNNDSNSNSTNNSNSSSSTSPAPSSSSSTSRDSGSKNDKNDKNCRRSNRKRKDISYADYFEPIEPKKGRRGRSAKIPKTENVEEEEQKSSKETVPIYQKTTDFTSRVLVDMENTYPDSQTQQQNKKLELARQPEMSMSFICHDMELQYDKCYKWVYIPKFPTTNAKRFFQERGIDKVYCDELISDFRMIGKKYEENEAVLVPVPPHLYPFKPLINIEKRQEEYEDSFQIKLPSDYKEDLEKKKKEGNNKELSKIFNWCDDLSDLSELEEEYSGPCCIKYDKETAVKDTDMCVRCHRHYSIYGIRWPVRKIRKVPGKKRVPKKARKQPSLQQQPSPTSTISSCTTPSSMPLPPTTSPPDSINHILSTSITSPPSSSPSSFSPPPVALPLTIPSPYLQQSTPSPILHEPPPLLITSPTSSSPISTSCLQQQQQNLYSNITPIESLRPTLPMDHIPPLYAMLNSGASTTEELDNNDISSNRCSSQFNNSFVKTSIGGFI